MMKKTVVLTILALVGLVGCSRYDKNPLVEVKGFYETPHQLRKMFVEEKEVIVRKPSRDNLSGGFFLFIGGVSGEYKEGTTTKYQVTHVRFAWEIKDNTYVITTLPLEKIRIKLVEKADTPTVSFSLDEFKVNKRFENLQFPRDMYENVKRRVENDLGRILRNYYNPHEALTEYLDYAVFTVGDGDWPKNINLPTGGFSQ
ncbi:MAG: hypothetical protein A3D52_00990 [Candidatus Taylorbacteria bacterium RIFCSPHIGHO2_02_FULL_44_36]|uniref:Uncharacterized protein n=1 Tax=Candidatus Taylorbacteria bacterium RIFCSPLOWO2_12_FULL_44_15c TaxID=1802333 RepID=A0A1G2P602_9BACT|nr:MAG: hypothetical protein A3D52_00990 [Candidatus Taylorbacteria bacterium RIFCSPHIGHO2_02_FULL_44_36]OHA43768.1 MAG: hypothetical protein A3G03_02070 [Candidatus Taylorbacteria bacterium RIFCSPLOWO2_12_FULL_44_15c]